MYNYCGIIYRLWGVCGVFAIVGGLCLLVAFDQNGPRRKNGLLAGVLLILFALGLTIKYTTYLINPEVESYQGIFVEEYRDSRVAPPLPYTMAYYFTDSEGEYSVFFLDVFSKKNIFNDSFQGGDTYIIYYETNTEIIVGVEKLELPEKD